MFSINSFLKFICAVLIFVAGTEAKAGLKEGVEAYRSGKYHAAIKEFRPLATKGNAAAQFNLGLMSELGQGVPQDYSKAASRYRQAAKQGYVEAQIKLGEMYAKGQGVPQ